jgi:hypothetical protein
LKARSRGCRLKALSFSTPGFERFPTPFAVHGVPPRRHSGLDEATNVSAPIEGKKEFVVGCHR